MVKFSPETLFEFYITDLSQMVEYDGAMRHKVKPGNLVGWKQIGHSSSKLDFGALSNLYFWSDLHIGHNNIIKYGERPFDDKDAMSDKIISNYYDTVKDGDVVIFGGDIAFGNRDGVVRLIQQLPGHKIHIVGNHDFNKRNLINYKHFQETHVCLSFIKDNVEYIVTHYPLNTVPEGCVNIHGHVHQNSKNHPQYLNMCVEVNGYSPVTLNQLKENNAQR